MKAEITSTFVVLEDYFRANIWGMNNGMEINCEIGGDRV